MLEDLDRVPWADLEHAYGSAEDVPGLLRLLLNSDPKVREQTLGALYANVFHQGTRYQASRYVVPFLIEMCANPDVPRRGDLLDYWGSLVTGYFTVQERPVWGDGVRVHTWDEEDDSEDQLEAKEPPQPDQPQDEHDKAVRELFAAGEEGEERDWDAEYAEVLHGIYRESLKGYPLLLELLGSEEEGVRGGAAWVLACLPTRASESVPALEHRFRLEVDEWVRGGIAFALGELKAPGELRRALAVDPSPAVRCIAACELARIAPREDLIEPLLGFVSQEAVDGYDAILGAGGESSGDAAFSISRLPAAVQQEAIPAICDRLDQARAFDTMPLVAALLSAAFVPGQEPPNPLSPLQAEVVRRMVRTQELWSIANLNWTFQAYGLPFDRDRCAALATVEVQDDPAAEALRGGLALSQINFLDEALTRIKAALALDPSVLDRSPAPDQAWLLYAKTLAIQDPVAAVEALRRAVALNPSVTNQIRPTWRLADLVG